MKTVWIFVLLSMLTRNPLVALLVIALLYVFIDRRFIGILPDFLAPLRRKKRVAELLREVQVNPQNANAQLELGESFFLRGQYRRAVNHLQNALVKMEDSALARFYLGAAYFHLEQLDQSRRELEESVRLNPKIAHGYPYLYLIKHGHRVGDDSRGEKLVDALLRYGSVKSFFDTGKYFKSIGRRREAARFFDEVLDIYRLSSPTMRRNFRKMAIYARLFGRWTERDCKG